MLHYDLLSFFITSWAAQGQQGQLDQIADTTRGTQSAWSLYKVLMSFYELLYYMNWQISESFFLMAIAKGNIDQAYVALMH